MQASVSSIAASQTRQLARWVRPGARASGRDMITVSMAQVLLRVADPVAIHEEAMRPLTRATARTPAGGVPVTSP